MHCDTRSARGAAPTPLLAESAPPARAPGLASRKYNPEPCGIHASERLRPGAFARALAAAVSLSNWTGRRSISASALPFASQICSSEPKLVYGTTYEKGLVTVVTRKYCPSG